MARLGVRGGVDRRPDPVRPGPADRYPGSVVASRRVRQHQQHVSPGRPELLGGVGGHDPAPGRGERQRLQPAGAHRANERFRDRTCPDRRRQHGRMRGIDPLHHRHLRRSKRPERVARPARRRDVRRSAPEPGGSGVVRAARGIQCEWAMHDRGLGRHDRRRGRLPDHGVAGRQRGLPPGVGDGHLHHRTVSADGDRGGYDPDARRHEPRVHRAVHRVRERREPVGPRRLGPGFADNERGRDVTRRLRAPGKRAHRDELRHHVRRRDAHEHLSASAFSTIRPSPCRERPLHSRSTCATRPGPTCPRPPSP